MAYDVPSFDLVKRLYFFMCGIVGLFLKDQGLRPQLGSLLSDMLVTMSDRGPDSAGIAIYGGDGEVSNSTPKTSASAPASSASKSCDLVQDRLDQRREFARLSCHLS